MSVKEYLEKKGIKPDTKYHSYDYLYKTMLEYEKVKNQAPNDAGTVGKV